jgi:hypothetical protein
LGFAAKAKDYGSVIEINPKLTNINLGSREMARTSAQEGSKVSGVALLCRLGSRVVLWN